MSTSPLYRSAFQRGAVTPTQVLAFHRLAFGSARMGPEDGGNESGGGQSGGEGQNGGQQQGATGSGGSGQDAGQQTGQGAQGGDNAGFPAGTPVSEMTDAQRAAYFQDKARKHENAWKGVIDKNLTPEQVLAMQQRLDEHDRAQLTDQERAVTDAKTAGYNEGRDTALAATRPLLVAAEFRAELKGKRTPEEVAQLIEPLDLTKFLTPKGDVDTAKVATYAAGIAPSGTGKNWPDTGAGRRGERTAASGQAGLDEAARRFGKPDATK